MTVPRMGYRLVVPQATAPTEAASLPTLAVLPFQDLGGDPAQDYFADGVTEDITTALSRFTSFAVIARNASFAYRAPALDIRQTARDLGAAYVLDGSVRARAGWFRITAQLIDSASGTYIWARSFDGADSEMFEVQDQITASVAAHVAPRIEAAEIARARRAPPNNLDGYDLYLRALHKLNSYREAEAAEALILLEHAIDLMPFYAPVLALAAYGYEHRITMGWPSAAAHSDGARAIALAERAVAAAPQDATVLSVTGFVTLAIARDHGLALQMMGRAIDINPYNVRALMVAGAGNIWAGDLDQALAYFHRAIALSPGQTSGALGGVAHVLLCQGRFHEALDWAARGLAENPGWDVMHWLVTAALGHLGRSDEAQQALSALLELTPDARISQIALANSAGYPARWGIILDGLRLAGLAE